MSKVILYTTHCIQCEHLENELKKAKISYEVVTDKEVMNLKGFKFVPMLEVDGVVLNNAKALMWIKESELKING